ncbi:MAG: hypothetical protein K9M56_05150 [Victivallales bacterium]|nr:hypothetical protein [Victivallales bacterium]
MAFCFGVGKKEGHYYHLNDNFKIVIKETTVLVSDNFNNQKIFKLFPGAVLYRQNLNQDYNLNLQCFYSPLIVLYAIIKGIAENLALKQLVEHFNISSSFKLDITLPKNSWLKKQSNVSNLNFINMNMQPAIAIDEPYKDYEAVYVNCINNIQKQFNPNHIGYIHTIFDKLNRPIQSFLFNNYFTELPVTYYAGFDSAYIYSLPVPTESISLVNLDLIENDFRKNPVIIADSTTSAQNWRYQYENDTSLYLSNNVFIWTSWFGLDETAEILDIAPLRNREIYFYSLYANWSPRFKKSVDILIKRFKEELNCEPHIAKKIDDYQILSSNEYLTTYQKGPSIRVMRDILLEEIDNKRLSEEVLSKAIIQDVIDEMSLTLIESANPLNLSWFMHSLAFSISEGLNLFKNKNIWVTKESVCVNFISCKIAESNNKKILSRLLNFYPTSEREPFSNFNFIYTPEKNNLYDFLKDNNLIKIISNKNQQASVLFLDNIIDFQEFDLSYELKVKDYFQQLQDLGCTIIISNLKSKAVETEHHDKFKALFHNTISLSEIPGEQNKLILDAETLGVSQPKQVIELKLGVKPEGWHVIDYEFSKADKINIVEQCWRSNKNIDETMLATGIKNRRTINNYRNKVIDKYLSYGWDDQKIAKRLNTTMNRVKKRKDEMDKRVGNKR